MYFLESDLLNIIHTGVGVNSPDTKGYTPIYACIRFFPEHLKALVGVGADVNYIHTKRNISPILMAAMTNPATLPLLVEAGADVNFVDVEQKNSLLFLLAQKTLSLSVCVAIDCLLKTNININAQDKKGMTALILSVIFAHEDYFLKIVNLQPNLALCDASGKNALHYFANQKFERPTSWLNGFSQLLKKNNSPLHALDKADKFPVNLAMENNVFPVVSSFLALGSPILNIKNNLLSVALKNCPKAIVPLLKKGLDVNQYNENQESPFSLLCQNKLLIRDYLQLFLSNGAKLDTIFPTGDNVLACVLKHAWEATPLLFHLGINPNICIQNNHQSHPFSILLDHLNKLINPNQQNSHLYKNNDFHLINDLFLLIDQFLDKGVDINFFTSKGDNLLFFIIDHYKTIKEFINPLFLIHHYIEHDIWLLALNAHNQTALELAKMYAYHDVASLLERSILKQNSLYLKQNKKPLL